MAKELSNSMVEQFIEQTFVQSIPASEITQCRQALEFLSPSAGQLFWQSENNAGIYIVLDGKVRLLDREQNLIETLEPGASFGASTLFPEVSSQLAAARASLNLKLGYFPATHLQPLMQRYPDLRSQLYQQAQVWQDTRIESSNSSPLRSLPRSALLEVNSPTSTPRKIRKAYFPSPSQRVGHLWQRLIQRYPFFQQQSGSDCGAASLVMVGRYWGKRLSVNRLRDIANVDRNGASLRGLAAAAESIGFVSRPVKASLNKLAEQRLPAIAHWEGKHYVVVYKITRDRVILLNRQ